MSEAWLSVNKKCHTWHQKKWVTPLSALLPVPHQAVPVCMFLHVWESRHTQEWGVSRDFCEWVMSHYALRPAPLQVVPACMWYMYGSLVTRKNAASPMRYVCVSMYVCMYEWVMSHCALPPASPLVVPLFESCRPYEWVMSNMSHLFRAVSVCESCRRWVNETCHTWHMYGWVVSHWFLPLWTVLICKCLHYVTHITHTHKCRKVSLYMSHATLCAAVRCHLHELGQFLHARVGVMSHAWMRHAIDMRTSCHTLRYCLHELGQNLWSRIRMICIYR